MKNFDAIYFHKDQRWCFTSLMQEFVSMGFFYSNMITQESKNKGYLGVFLKEVN